MSSETQLQAAGSLLDAHKPVEALELLTHLINTHGESSEALVLVGRAYLGLAAPAKAQQAFHKAFELDQTNSLATYYLGRLAQQNRDTLNAENWYQRCINSPRPPRDGFVQFAGLLSQKKAQFDALDVMRRAESIFPDDNELRYVRGRFALSAAPLWHIPMLADTARNDAYEAAINATVKPGDMVLDIGTGSGLLAMMAVRAGAAHVYACESNTLVARLAGEIVEQNGFSDKITILPKHSGALKLGIDLPRRADVLTTEIFDNALVGEGALPTLAHARAELLTQEARLIPSGATLYGALMCCAHHRHFHETGTVNGFDLSAMNALSHPLGYKDMDADTSSGEARQISEEFTLQAFDFTKDVLQIFTSTNTVKVTGDGPAHSLAMWFDLALADGISFSTASTKAHQHWRRTYQILSEELPVSAGDTVSIGMSYDRYFDFRVKHQT